MSEQQSTLAKLVFICVIVAIAAIVGFNYNQKSKESVTANAPSNSFERAQQQAQEAAHKASEAVSTATEAAKQQAQQSAQDAQAAANSLSDKMKELTAEQQGQLAPAAGGNAPASQPNQ